MQQKQFLNKMGVMPVGKLMLSMGVPMILSMVLQAVYNIVDSAFVSNIPQSGELALNALTLAFPVQMLMVAVGIGTGVGANALLAKRLGEGDSETVNKTAGNAFFLGFVICILCILFGVFGVRRYISSQTANAQITQMAVDYLHICCIVSFGVIFFSLFEKLLQATGRSLYSTIAQIAEAVTNIILDPILIYGLLGLPELGVKGAAYATVIGQIVSALLGLLFHFKLNREIDNHFKYLKPDVRTIREIYAIGLPAIIAQALMSFMTYGLNIILVRIDEAVVTAYGLYYKIQQFLLFAAFGLRDAITPIVSFNHGMRNEARIKAGIRYGMVYTLVIMAVGTVALELFASQFASIFGLSGQTQELCVSAIRVISLSFVFAGANIAFQGIFQALDGGLESLVVSVCRQLIFVLPVAWIFSRIVGQSLDSVWLVWSTFPIAEILSAVIAVLFMRRIAKTRLRPRSSAN